MCACRCLRRQEELMRQLCSAAKVIGNTELENKFAEGIYIYISVYIYVCMYVHICMYVCMYI